MVNNGAARTATIKGIPDGVSAFDVFVTDENERDGKDRRNKSD